MFGNLFKKEEKKPLLSEEDYKELRDLERKAYMEKARELIKKKGEQKAISEIKVNQGGYS